MHVYIFHILISINGLPVVTNVLPILCQCKIKYLFLPVVPIMIGEFEKKTNIMAHW